MYKKYRDVAQLDSAEEKVAGGKFFWEVARSALQVTIEYEYIGTWRSLVAHYLGVVGVAGSNPVVPTI